MLTRLTYCLHEFSQCHCEPFRLMYLCSRRECMQIWKHPPDYISPSISGTIMFAGAFAASPYVGNIEKWNF